MTTEKFVSELESVGVISDFLAFELTRVVNEIDDDVYDRHGADIDDLCYTLTRVKLDCECLIADMKMLGEID